MISWVVGRLLPELEYNNQKVEAAFRRFLHQQRMNEARSVFRVDGDGTVLAGMGLVVWGSEAQLTRSPVSPLGCASLTPLRDFIER